MGSPTESTTVAPSGLRCPRPMGWLAYRCRFPELMDDPSLETDRHEHALQGLARINWWSGSVRIVWSPIRALAHTLGVSPLRVLDVASGAGDVPIGLWRTAHRTGLQLQIDGCDCSSRAVEFARTRAARLNASVHFFPLGALADPLPSGYDVVMCSLFLHHLGEAQTVEVLRRMAQAARHMVLVNDLIRSAAGLALAHLGTRLLSTSEVVHTDGPRSVRAAYTREEIRELAHRAGLKGATVVCRWPFRFLLQWQRT